MTQWANVTWSVCTTSPTVGGKRTRSTTWTRPYLSWVAMSVLRTLAPLMVITSTSFQFLSSEWYTLDRSLVLATLGPTRSSARSPDLTRPLTKWFLTILSSSVGFCFSLLTPCGKKFAIFHQEISDIIEHLLDDGIWLTFLHIQFKFLQYSTSLIPPSFWRNWLKAKSVGTNRVNFPENERFNINIFQVDSPPLKSAPFPSLRVVWCLGSNNS